MSRRWTAALGGAVAATCGAAGALAAATPAPGAPIAISVDGQVAATHVSLTLHAGPTGEHPTGHLALTGAYALTATPTCVNAASHAAVIGYRVDSGPDAGRGLISEADPIATPIASGGFAGSPGPAPAPPAAPAAPAAPTGTAGARPMGAATGGPTGAPAAGSPSRTEVRWAALLDTPPVACPPPGSPAPPSAQQIAAGPITGTVSQTGGSASLPLQTRVVAVPPATPYAPVGAPAGPPGPLTESADGAVWRLDSAGDRLLVVPATLAAGPVREVRLPTAHAGLAGIAPDAAAPCADSCAGEGVWFTEPDANAVGHASPDGTVREIPLGGAPARPLGIASDLAGGAWFTEPDANAVGHIAPDGTVTTLPLSAGAQPPEQIATDLAGGAWFTERAGAVAHLAPDGTVHPVDLPVRSVRPVAIAADPSPWSAAPPPPVTTVIRVSRGPPGPPVSPGVPGPVSDGAPAAWVSEGASGRIARVSSDGTVQEFPVPGGGAVGALAAGPAGTGGPGAWFTEPGRGRIASIDSSGTVADYAVPGDPGELAVTEPLGARPLSGYPISFGVWWSDGTRPGTLGLARFPDAGGGGLFTGGFAGVPTTARPVALALLRLGGLRFVKGAVLLTVACPAGRVPCRGRADLVLRTRAGRPVPGTHRRFDVPAGRSRRIRLPLGRVARRMLRRGRAVRGSVTVTVPRPLTVRSPVVTVPRRAG